MRPINEVIVHCAATRPNWMAGRPLADKVAEIRRWHTRDRGWRDIGYHWIIDRDGSVAPGRPESQIGAHVAGRNARTIGVCLLGGFGSRERDRFEQHFTPEQDRALRQLLREIQARHRITRISGHHEYAAKACPGFEVRPWLGQAAPNAAPAPVQMGNTPTLRRGSRGAAVQRLQNLLDIPADSIFGPVTEAAVRAYQASAGLDVDGVVGPQTWRALLNPPVQAEVAVQAAPKPAPNPLAALLAALAALFRRKP